MNRECTQGDTDSPVIFNIIIDSVLWVWKQDKDFGSSKGMFYANDWLIENNNSAEIQQDLHIMFKLHEKLGLRTNETKNIY